jgi:hypothetical protein
MVAIGAALTRQILDLFARTRERLNKRFGGRQVPDRSWRSGSRKVTAIKIDEASLQRGDCAMVASCYGAAP